MVNFTFTFTTPYRFSANPCRYGHGRPCHTWTTVYELDLYVLVSCAHNVNYSICAVLHYYFSMSEMGGWVVISSAVFGGTERQTCTSANLLEFETGEAKGKMSYRSALTCYVVINFDRKRMSNVGFGTQLKNATIFHCNIFCLRSCSIHIW
jgi:hypothetical protein